VGEGDGNDMAGCVEVRVGSTWAEPRLHDAVTTIAPLVNARSSLRRVSRMWLRRRVISAGSACLSFITSGLKRRCDDAMPILGGSRVALLFVEDERGRSIDPGIHVKR
jgi:hypothetical protein